jgi:hypothetical protein
MPTPFTSPLSNQVSLKTRIGLLHDERKSVGGISRRVVFPDRWTLPANLDQNISDRLFDDGAGAVLQRRMIDHGKFDEGIFLAPRPNRRKIPGPSDRRHSPLRRR